MVEDEDAKVRRNLVAVSSVILLLAWLDVPLSAIAGRLLGEKPESATFVLPAWKVWLAGLVLLNYCLVRYLYSDEAEKGRSALAIAQQARFAELLERHIARLGRAIERRALPPGAFRDSINSFIEQVGRNRGRSDDFRTARIHAKLSRASGGPPALGLDHNLSIVLSFDRDLGANATRSVTRYSMSPRLNWWMNRRAEVEAAVLSKGAVAHAWPLGIAGVAVAVILWKLGRAILDLLI
ncbi:hypothetical protein [Variovorax paradoxus]|uniref:hypothetical protein n=1 Tax=Variovorax paradoxus TaxID=34073 RepID=UPI0019320F07|nr:hypothetical protein INQ48_13915 [Variovorax paradoxus]